MLAISGTEDLLDQPGYLYEPKLDGIRALCFKKKKLKFLSRNELNITTKYPEFNFLDNIKADECILDGEIVVYDKKGHPSFSLWMQREQEGLKVPATYVAFDILYLNGKSLLHLPLQKRKKILEKVVKEGKHLQTAFYTINGRALWRQVKKRALEGVIAKKINSTYELNSRSSTWRKIKLSNDIDCVILGFTVEKRQLTSLALGLYVNGKLQFVGKVGTGFDEKAIVSLRKKLDKIKLKNAIVETEKGVIPVKPVLVVQVAYQQITHHQKLRAPVFMRLRKDKKAKECGM